MTAEFRLRAAAAPRQPGRAAIFHHGMAEPGCHAITDLAAAQRRFGVHLATLARDRMPARPRVAHIGFAPLPAADHWTCDGSFTHHPLRPATVAGERGFYTPGGALDSLVSRAPFHVIALEGPWHNDDQIHLLCRLRELLADGGCAAVFGEFIDDTMARAYSPLPCVRALRKFLATIGLQVEVEQDLSEHARQSTIALRRLLERRGRWLGFRYGSAALANVLRELDRAETEFASARRRWLCMVWRKRLGEIDGEVEYGDERSCVVEQMGRAFERSFGESFDEELWRWKYEGGRGRCVITRRGAEVQSHYGGISRDLHYFGKRDRCLQVSDVMTVPEGRRTYGRRSYFFKGSDAFFERNVGNSNRHLLAYGFPHRSHATITKRIGVGAGGGHFDEVIIGEGHGEGAALEHEAFTWTPAQVELVDCLWQAMKTDFAAGIICSRDAAYLTYRYRDNPFWRRGKYSAWVLGAGACQGDAVRAVAFLLERDEDCLVMDVVCRLADVMAVLVKVRQILVAAGKPLPLRFWGMREWLRKLGFAEADIVDRGVEITIRDCRPAANYDYFRGKWWLTAGDMEFL